MQEKGKFFKFFSSDVQMRLMIVNEIYCYVNGFWKWNIGKKTSYNIGNKKFSGKICNLKKKKEKTSQKKKYLWNSNHQELKVREDRKENWQDYN